MSETLQRRRLIDLYASHPFNAETILERVRRDRGTIDGLTAEDLASDPTTEISDQNHVGGLAATRALIAVLGLGSASRVLDVGAGLGGTARLLATAFGCRVDGLDLSPRRVADARRLTELVGLEERVRFHCGDVREVELAGGYDLVIGQGTFVHFPDLETVIGRCAGWLAPGGALVLEDSCLLREPQSPREEAGVTDLQRIWLSVLSPRGRWQAAMRLADLGVEAPLDQSSVLISYFEALRQSARGPSVDEATRLEIEGWRLALELASQGLLGYFRLTGRRAAS
jgi:SAM-dependent methyltransferase